VNDTFVAVLAVLSSAACGATAPAASLGNPETKGGTTISSASARPSCDAIDEACDPHAGKGGHAKECHDFGESAASTEAQCAARKAECLAACPSAKR